MLRDREKGRRRGKDKGREREREGGGREGGRERRKEGWSDGVREAGMEREREWERRGRERGLTMLEHYTQKSSSYNNYYSTASREGNIVFYLTCVLYTTNSMDHWLRICVYKVKS